MFKDVGFDESLIKEGKRDRLSKTSDLKYYVLTFAFLGLGFLIISKFNKK